jgi:signal transduction histidine kinase/CheY-like chemotaxis protein
MTKARVLVVEDEGTIATHIQSTLRGLGHTIAATAFSGEEAIQRAIETRPDLILMDIRLQGEMDGIQAADRIHAELDVPIIYMTAFADAETLQRAKVTAPYGYILKPFEQRELNVVIEMALHKHQLEKELQTSKDLYHRRSDELQVLHEISLRLNAQLETPKLLQLIVEQAVMLLDADAGCFYLYEPPRGELVLSVATNFYKRFLGVTLKPGEGLAGLVFETRRPLVIADYGAWPGRATVYQNETGFKAMLAVPLLAGDKVLGVLDLGGQCEQTFDDHAVWLAELFAAQAAVALDNARLHAEVKQRARELAALNKTSQTIASILDKDRMLRLVMAEIRSLLDAQGASVLLFDAANNELVFAAASSPSAQELVGTRMPATAGAAGWTVQNKQALLISDAQSDERFYKKVDATTGLTTRSLVAVPLIFNDAVIGVVEAINKASGAFTQHDLDMLEVMAGSIAVAIENVWLFTSLDQEKEHLELLYCLGQQLLESLDVREVAQRALDGICGVVKAQHGNVLVRELDSAAAPLVVTFGYNPGAGQILQERCRQGHDCGLEGWVIRERQTAQVDDVTRDPRWLHLPGLHDQIRSALCVPLLNGTDLVGVLSIFSEQAAFFNEAARRLVESAAATVTIAIANARLFQAERKQFNRLHEFQAQLVHAEKMAAVGRLAASIAHEINNPLQAVQGCLALLQEELAGQPRPDKVARYLTMAESEIDRVGAIVRRMRDFYRPAREEMRPTDVNAVVQNVLELSRKQLEHNGMAVESEWANNLPAIQANASYLKQVFLNLTLNAIDAVTAGKRLDAPPGPRGTLRVRTAPDQLQLKGNHQLIPAVRIEFSDTGEGIPPEALPHIFEPFFTTKGSGTGLGLFISYEIVEAHGGQITASSQAGAGTLFTIVLPVEQA